MIDEYIAKLVQYGLDKKLIEPEDKIYTINQYLEIFKLDDYEEPKRPAGEIDLEEILTKLTDEAYDRYIIKSNDVVTRDLFDTKLMGVLVPRPSQVIRDFREKYQKSPEAATEFFYKFSQDTDYIRRYRVKKDWKWTVDSPYGIIDITVNLSKPEKDPKAIAAAKNAAQSRYPKCQLCMENEGYAGRMNHPARQNHRVIPVTVNGSRWGFQYSPYVYYNEHCIVFNGEHVPMKIDRTACVILFDFVRQFPHYFLGSNADLPIVGGSILSHDHFQGGHYQFAMADAKVEKHYTVKGFEDVETGILNWPLSVLRLRSKDENRLIEMADHIKKKGNKLIVVTALEVSSSSTSRHSSGKLLYEFADVVLDNQSAFGDASLDIEGLDSKVCGTSSFSTCLLLQQTIYEAVKDMTEKGYEAPVYKSANIDGGREFNNVLEQKYADRIWHI